jgi:SAM-dependent methyltransferase
VDTPEQAWALDLFSHSVLKQEKFRRIVEALGDVDGQSCLDLGGDNGVISLLLRRRGGTWCSADLDARTVDAIRQVVGERVFQIDGTRLPFSDRQFDVVVVVDLLEHVTADRELAQELARILKSGGRLIVNVPHVKPTSVLNRVRHAVGLTDEQHGHVRPGYTPAALRDVLGPAFEVESTRTYSRAFSESIDLVLNLGYGLKSGQTNAVRSVKGTVVTSSDLSRMGRARRMLAMLYPILKATAALDALLPLQAGYKLILQARRRASSGDARDPARDVA